MSVRSADMKMFIHIVILLSNLKNGMQTEQHAMKKSHSISNRNKVHTGLLFVVEGSLAENLKYSISVYLISCN